MKRRIVGGLLLALGLWPAIHAGLTVAYGIDPWKLAGFAMYSVPGPMRTLRVAGVYRDGRFAPRGFRSYDIVEQVIIDALRERRRALGDLADFDGAAAAFLDLHPDWEGVLITELSLTLDPETAHLVEGVVAETFWRDGTRDPFEFPETR